MTTARFRHAFLLLLTAAVTIAFVAMIRDFLLTIVLAAIFTGVSYPLFRRVLAHLRHPSLSAAVTIVLLLTLVLAPLLAVLGAAANEALQMTETIGPRVERLVSDPNGLDARLRALPFYERLAPYRDQLLGKATEVVGSLSAALFSVLSATTVATASALFYSVVMLYTMFYLFTDGPALLGAVTRSIPLDDSDKARVLDRFISVTRATLRGTVFIGVAQGVLGGLAFWTVGIEGALFWGTVMTVLSIVPGVGGALVWVPAAIILALTGHLWQGVALAVFSSLVVGSVDNLLRPRLVGRDAQLHELMIFFSTLGGLLLFGVMGFIIGPVLAGLFVTVWEMFGQAFQSALGHEVPPEPDATPNDVDVTEPPSSDS